MNSLDRIRRLCTVTAFLFLMYGNRSICLASDQSHETQAENCEETEKAGWQETGEESREQEKEAYENVYTRQDAKKVEEDILGDMELGGVDRAVDQLLENDMSIGELVKKLMDGGQPLEGETLKKTVSEVLQEAAGIQKETWIHILLLALLSSVLTNLSRVFDNQQISDISFYMIYLFLFVILLKSFDSFSTQIGEVLSGITEFMRALLPSYYLAITASNGISTAGVFYQMIIIIIYLAENLILKFLLPGVRIYLLMALVNYLTGEQFLSKMTELLRDGILWMLKTIVGVILGIQLIQRMVSPAVDALRQTVIGKTAGVIPGIGNIFSGITEMVLGSAMLIKNCLGAAAVIIMLLAAVSPVIRLGISAFFYQLAAACIQPVTDKRMVGCLHTMGESIGMLLKLLLAIEVLFLLTVAILAGSLG